MKDETSNSEEIFNNIRMLEARENDYTLQHLLNICAALNERIDILNRRMDATDENVARLHHDSI